MLIMPAGIPVAVYAKENLKMMLAIVFPFAEGGHKNECNSDKDESDRHRI